VRIFCGTRSQGPGEFPGVRLLGLSPLSENGIVEADLGGASFIPSWKIKVHEALSQCGVFLVIEVFRYLAEKNESCISSGSEQWLFRAFLEQATGGSLPPIAAE
jgi:hypothetical protein